MDIRAISSRMFTELSMRLLFFSHGERHSEIHHAFPYCRPTPVKRLDLGQTTTGISLLATFSRSDLPALFMWIRKSG